MKNSSLAQPITYRTVGVLGGMGALATVDFLQKLVAATPAANDQEHVPLLVRFCPEIPDRADALLAPLDSSSARVGYLVSVRGAQLHVGRLDDIAFDLRVEATCITRSDNNILYQFSVSAAGQLLLAGRAAVVINADALPSTSGDAP